MHRSVAAKYLYILGGCALSAEREPIRQIERIHVEPITRNHVRVIAENCGQLEVARRAPACFLTQQHQILIAGGCLGPNDHTDKIEIFEVPSKSTKIIDNKLEIGASCSAFDPFSTSKFKPIFGGFESHACLDDVQIIEEPTWKTRKLPKRLPKIKNATVLEVTPREFWLFGGWEDEQRTSKAIRRVVFNEDFTDYTADFHGFLPYPVEGHSCVRNGSDVFLIGGFDGFAVIDTIIRYNLDRKEAEILSVKLAEKRENHMSAILSEEYLVVAAGWNSRSSLDDVEVFRLSGRDLEPCEVEGRLNLARNRPAGVAVGDADTQSL